MIAFCIVITLLLCWNVALTVGFARLLRQHKLLLAGQNSLTVTVFRLVMVLSGQELNEDDEAPDNVDDLLDGGKS